MRKQKRLFVAITLCAIVFTGCKKKEPVDLTSLHTTAAVEKETLPESTEALSTEASQEDNASDSSQESASKFSLKTTMKSATENNVTVEYPEISNMKDTEKQKQVNAVLKGNALAAAHAYEVKDGQTLALKASIESANLKRITVTYKGEIKGAGASDTTRVFFSNAIDLETANNLRLSDYTDAYTVAGYIASGDYKLESTSGADENAIRAYINASDKTTDYYFKKLSGADFSGGYSDAESDAAPSWPEYFSYEKQGAIYISIPVSKELGGYVIVRYSPDNK